MRKIIVVLICLIVLVAVVFITIVPWFCRYTFRNDADYHWCNDSIRFYIESNRKLPENWQEMYEMVTSANLYEPVPAIEQRMNVNFALFSQLNRTKWKIDNKIDATLLFAFTFKSHKIDTLHFLEEYCDRLRIINDVKESDKSE